MKNLKYILILILGSFSHSAVFSQIFTIEPSVEYRQEYLECDTDYDDLTRGIGNGATIPDTFRISGKLFSGCAKFDAKENKMYYMMYIKNGFVEHQLQYFHSGDKAADFNFKDGQSHGYQTMYYGSGQKYIEEFFQNGVKQGIHRRWYRDGQLAREVLWRNGIMIYEHLYDKNGVKKTVNDE